MPVTAADIPIDLYDLILYFFRLQSDDDEGWIGKDEHDNMEAFHYDEGKRREWGTRNVVLANKHELGWLALVCRQWARLCQPSIFQEVTLRNRDDVESLLGLLADPKCRISNYIQALDLSHSVATYPCLPWIHIVVVRLIPKLRQFRGIKRMTVTGPVPAGQSFSSIHGILPIRCPFFATGIDKLVLKDLHLRSFGHLVQVLKELPSLSRVQCENVTWHSPPDTPWPVATSYPGRDIDEEVRYSMSGCTDNTAAGWLSWLLAPKRSWRLEQQDSDALCRIASDFCKDGARFAGWGVVSRRYQDVLAVFRAYDQDRNPLTPNVTVYLTSAVPGERIRRRVRAIHLRLPVKVSAAVGWNCWPAIDSQLATLSSLRTVLVSATTHDELVLFASSVVTPKMCALRDSATLKYAKRAYGRYLWYTHSTVDSKDNGRWVDDFHDIL